MKYLLIAFLLQLNFVVFSQNDYQLIINDTEMEISLDKEYEIDVDGKTVQFKLLAKDTLSYVDDLFSFHYPSEYRVSQIDIDDEIEQIIIMTAEGSGILIQKYSTFDPTVLNELMLSEITKESLNYGFEMNREDYSRELKSGQTVNVDKAVLTYKNEQNIYEVASLGKKDEGIMVMTMMMDEELSEQGKKIIEMMWNSLEFMTDEE